MDGRPRVEVEVMSKTDVQGRSKLILDDENAKFFCA